MIRETVDQDGKTRIRERYTVSAPLAGRLLRIGLDPGDEVTAGETHHRQHRAARSRAARRPGGAAGRGQRAGGRGQAQADDADARGGGRRAGICRERAEARARRPRRRVPRAVSESQVDNALMAYRMRSARRPLGAARRGNRSLRTRAGPGGADALAAAGGRIAGQRPPDDGGAPQVPEQGVDESPPADGESPASDGLGGPNNWHFIIRSPITGRVLRVLQESSAVITPGTNLAGAGRPRGPRSRNRRALARGSEDQTRLSRAPGALGRRRRS